MGLIKRKETKKMKRFKTAALLTLAITLFAAPLFAEGEASPELIAKGRDLFNNKEGLKVKFACILCHKGDKAIKKSDVDKVGEKLPSVINKYLTTKSKGAALAADSEEMKALAAYIKNEHSK